MFAGFSSHGSLIYNGSLAYSFIAITPRSTGVVVLVSIMYKDKIDLLGNYFIGLEYLIDNISLEFIEEYAI